MTYALIVSGYNSDGQEGINIPESMESDALHEIGANMGGTMGSSINISTNTGAQIASDVGRSQRQSKTPITMRRRTRNRLRNTT